MDDQMKQQQQQQVQPQVKQGASCCGCCCDMRRAVIIVDAIQLILAIVAAVLYLSGRELISQGLDDSEYDLTSYENALKISGIISAVGVAFYVLGIVGASIYNMFLVGFAALWYIVSFVLSIVFSIKAVNEFNNDNTGQDIPVGYGSLIISGIITALFVYPHVGLIVELKNGTMSAVTYPREQQSCCCV